MGGGRVEDARWGRGGRGTRLQQARSGSATRARFALPDPSPSSWPLQQRVQSSGPSQARPGFSTTLQRGDGQEDVVRLANPLYQHIGCLGGHLRVQRRSHLTLQARPIPLGLSLGTRAVCKPFSSSLLPCWDISAMLSLWPLFHGHSQNLLTQSWDRNALKTLM